MFWMQVHVSSHVLERDIDFFLNKNLFHLSSLYFNRKLLTADNRQIAQHFNLQFECLPQHPYGQLKTSKKISLTADILFLRQTHNLPIFPYNKFPLSSAEAFFFRTG